MNANCQHRNFHFSFSPVFGFFTFNMLSSKFWQFESEKRLCNLHEEKNYIKTFFKRKFKALEILQSIMHQLCEKYPL